MCTIEKKTPHRLLNKFKDEAEKVLNNHTLYAQQMKNCPTEVSPTFQVLLESNLESVPDAITFLTTFYPESPSLKTYHSI